MAEGARIRWDTGPFAIWIGWNVSGGASTGIAIVEGAPFMFGTM